MNQTLIVLQVSLTVISLLQLLLAGFSVLLNPRNRNNRYLAAHLVLLSVIGFSASQLSASANASEARPWLYSLGAATLAVGPALLIVTISLLRPDDWRPSRVERWVWRLGHVLLIVPIVLVLGDAFFGTSWIVSGVDLNTYKGGFIATNEYTRGSIARLLIPLNLYVLSSVPLLLIVYTLWRRRPSAPIIQARARWLLVAQLGAMIIQLGTMGRINTLATTTITDVVVVAVYTALILRGLVSDARMSSTLANMRLRPKLNISLGAALLGLMIVSAITIYANVSLQNQVGQALDRQRTLAELTSSINNTLRDVQNRASRFYDNWTVNGFEGSETGGFAGARAIHLDPLQDALEDLRQVSGQIEGLEADADTFTDYKQIVNTVDAYEQTLLQMSNQMASLGYQATGSLGRLHEFVQESGQLLTGAESPLASLLTQMEQQEQDFFSRSNLTSAQQTVRLGTQLQEQINAADADAVSDRDKDRLSFLLNRYQDEFAAATDVHLKLQANRSNLADQGEEVTALVDALLDKQQARLSAAVQNLEERQTATVITVIGLALLTLFASATAAYFVSGKVIQPLRDLGETASHWGAGDVAIRAAVHGRDEIGATASAFNLMADRIGELLGSLEQQVADRTRDLTRRTGYLEASAEVGRAASSILETDELLRHVVDSIRTQFDLYYVGLFLRESGGEWALLRAGTGPAGRAMLARGHRIEVGQGMIGWSIANAKSRVASDVGGDAVRLATAELPETRSEAAIPLRSRGQVLGALSVQSTQPDAFDDAAVTVLQSMADQVSVALDNARLYSASQEALETARRAYREIGRTEWAELVRCRSDLGYRSDKVGSVAIDPDEAWRPETQLAYHSGETVKGETGDGVNEGTTESDGRRPLAVPIQAHGRVIGVVDTFKTGHNGDWTPDEIEVIQEITSQLALALDNARLHQETQLRALRQQLAREITEKVRAAPDVESIAATATEELVKALGGSRGFIELRADAADDGPNGRHDSGNE